MKPHLCSFPFFTTQTFLYNFCDVVQISLVAPNEREDIQLPANSKAVRALCVKPCSRLALFASLGKKLSVVR